MSEDRTGPGLFFAAQRVVPYITLMICFLSVPLVILVGKILYTRLRGVDNSTTAYMQAQTLSICTLAFGEAIVIWGLVCQLLQADSSFAFGIMAYGLVFLIVDYFIVRRLISREILLRLVHQTTGGNVNPEI